MNAFAGRVRDLHSVVDNGPPENKWNLVVLGDGYQTAELGRFATHVRNFVTELQRTPPFTAFWRAINIYRVDVESRESGADDPTAAPRPITRRTYFDATFGGDWRGTTLDRLLTVDSSNARAIATWKLPQMHQVLVLVNTDTYGGSGVGQVAVASAAAGAYKIAIHEIGHSAFGLADEYVSKNVSAPTAEPAEPNITLSASRANPKWGNLIQASTPMPSASNPGCPNYRVTVTLPAGTVGAFEGAGHARCGVYRPSRTCYMRNYAPFCPVCSRVIEETLERHL